MTEVIALISSGRYRQEHYEDVAEILRKTGEPDYYEGQAIANLILEHLVEMFADLFAADNPLFDRDRFLSACGLDYEGEE